MNYLINHSSENDYLGVDAAEIQKELGIVRNNASTILNELLKNEKLVKINSRPVTFIPKDILLQLDIPKVYKKNNTFSIIEFKEIVEILNKVSNNNDPFRGLVGYNNSLIQQIEQCKAAVMYPPYGLHTLILGESGVGKTTFAAAIYEYAKIQKKLNSKDFPFISFNCSDYFNAPQLLLAQLFGHVKGAFTGADTDKIGLVEKANNGILFLDEVHRLPPDGQEMLFYLMDKGEFSRLGETSPRKSKVLIICATTEDPDDAFLSTFIRRIPVIISLPSYREKAIDERFEVIEKLFHYESIKLNMSIRISPEILKALALYHFKDGNIGLLSSEIKLLCAKAFFHYLKTEKELNIDFKMLNKDIKENIFSNNNVTNNIKTFLNMFSQDLIIHPNTSFENKYISDSLNEDVSVYDLINKKLEELKNHGLSKEEIDIEINSELENYFNSVITRFNPDELSIRNLYKVIPKDVVDASVELVNLAQEKLRTKFNNKFIFGFAFHINSLLKRIKENTTIKNHNMAIIRRQYKDEFKVSSELVRKLSERFGVQIPEDEKGFLAILLTKIKLDDHNINIGVILVCHGDSTASSLANLANKLLNVDHIKAIDMPLESKINDIYDKVKVATFSANKGKGVILLVDMGSLSNFGVKIMNETGIKVRTISNVSTLLVLDVLRSVLYKNDDIDSIYESIVSPEVSKKIETLNKKKVIITVCATGQGAGLIAKRMLTDLIEDSYKNTLEIIAVNFMDVENNINALEKDYDIIACVGSIRPKTNIPFFPMNKLLNKGFQQEFIKFIDVEVNKSPSKTSSIEESSRSVYEDSKQMLEQYVKYINPRIAVIAIKKFIEKLSLNYEDDKQDNLLDLLIHMGCMLDRRIHGDIIKFEDLYNFKNKNIDQFNKIKEAITILEKEFDVEVGDNEICYIIKVLNR